VISFNKGGDGHEFKQYKDREVLGKAVKGFDLVERWLTA
jgi:hypothetical protein